jgi:large subunit ribosomal protein L25
MSSKTNYELAVESRTELGTGAVRRARRVGKIPAVIYSRGAETAPLFVDAKEWESLTRNDFNLLTLLNGKKKTAAVVKEIQHNYLKAYVVHIDFQEVKMDEKITAGIPVRPSHGEAIGVAQGGNFEQSIHEIEVNCLPGDLPEHLEADITGLEIGDSLHVGEIALPENVELITNPKLAVFHVAKSAVAEEEEEETAGEEGEATEGAEGEAEASTEAAE